MNILIFGAGGIGSVIGGFLARQGHDIFLLGRPWHMDAIQKKGLLITGIWGEYRIKAFKLFTEYETLKKKNVKFDLIFLTVKSYDTEAVVDGLCSLMGERTTLVSFQNGLGNIEIILKRIKSEDFLPGRVIFGVETEPGMAKVTVCADATVIGVLPGVKPKTDPDFIAKTLSLSKVETRAVPDIMTYVWSKVIYNCALNGICSIREIPYGHILRNDDTRKDMEAIVRECYTVGNKRGIVLKPDTEESYLELLTEKLIPSTANHYPSMLQDLRKGRRIEIDFLNGAISRLGVELGVATPINDKVSNLVRKLLIGRS